MSDGAERRVALVTGAAQGIGQAIVRCLLQAGYAVAALDQSADSLRSSVEGNSGPSVLTVSGDAADAEVLQRAVRATLDRFGRLDAAVFNAGIAGVSAPLKSYPIAVFDEVMRVNVHGPWHGIQAVAPVMKAAGSGAIVIVSSINGIRGFGTFAAYAASKQAVMGLARTAAIDLAQSGIRVNSLHPGLVDTQMMQQVEETVGASDSQAARAAFNAFVPLGRYAAPAEIARVAAFLLSDQASYITGAGYIVDGGFTAGIPAGGAPAVQHI